MKAKKSNQKREIHNLKIELNRKNQLIEYLNERGNRLIREHLESIAGIRLTLQIYSDFLNVSSKSLDKEGDYGKASVHRHQHEVLKEITE